MKEWIVDLFPKGGGFKTATRVFAPNQSVALSNARKMNPTYNTGNVRLANPLT